MSYCGGLFLSWQRRCVDVLAAALILLTAVLLDAAIGDPVYPLHPVRLMGKAISMTETILREIRLSGYLGGALLLTSMLALFGWWKLSPPDGNKPGKPAAPNGLRRVPALLQYRLDRYVQPCRTCRSIIET